MFARRTLIWRYCAVGSFIVNAATFAAFIFFLKSPTILFELENGGGDVSWPTADSSTSEALRKNLVDGRSAESRLARRLQDGGAFANGSSLANRRAAINDSKSAKAELDKLHKNMTILKVNMSGVQDIVRNFNRSAAPGVTEIPVNPHPFRYLLNCPHVCGSDDVYLLVYVHTAPDHVKRRIVIRQTWGNWRQFDFSMRVIFVMGRTEVVDVQRAVEFEAEQYVDIVQEDFLDTYRNLTYKGIAGLKWIENNCRQARFVLKTDDDIFVNTYVLMWHLTRREKKETEGKVTSSRFLMCLVWNGMKVMRDGKWKVDVSEWKDSFYPTYCSGSAYIISTDVAIDFHRISYHVPFFWVDDFYITGLLPLKLGDVEHIQFMSSYVLNGLQLEAKFTGPQWYKYIFSHVHNLNAIQRVWRTVGGIMRGEIVPVIKTKLPGELDNKDSVVAQPADVDKRADKPAT